MRLTRALGLFRGSTHPVPLPAGQGTVFRDGSFDEVTGACKRWNDRPQVTLVLAAIGLVLGLLFHPDLSVIGLAESGLPVSGYGAALKAHVDDRGYVDYRGLKSSRAGLDAFCDAMAALNADEYEKWSTHEKIAFWINAYNALTLKVIIDHYPIQPSLLGSVRFPKNSIRQIPGVWDTIRFEVMGRKLTLDQIEHEILRKEFNEPRVHMAINCASKGCPPLRAEPYDGTRLNAQLNDQSTRFLANPGNFRVDRVEERVYLSSIFKWFGADFEKGRGSVLGFVGSHQDRYDREAFEKTFRSWSIAYLDYDWSLNER